MRPVCRSTLAYQGYGRGLDMARLRDITSFATGDLVPDLTFCLDLPAMDSLWRKQTGHGVDWDRIEQQAMAFHERVRQGFLELARAEPARWVVLDARLPVADLQAQIRSKVEVQQYIAHPDRTAQGGVSA